jgi:hypothetical protein
MYRVVISDAVKIIRSVMLESITYAFMAPSFEPVIKLPASVMSLNEGRRIF